MNPKFDIEYYPSGNIKRTVNFDDEGKKHGVETLFHDVAVCVVGSDGNGGFTYSYSVPRRWRTTPYVHGLKHGDEIEYFPDGGVRLVSPLVDGKLQGEQLLYYWDRVENSRSLSVKTNFCGGKKEGTETHYRTDQSICAMHNWKDDKPHGESIGYDRFGGICWKELYDQGVFIPSGNIEPI